MGFQATTSASARALPLWCAAALLWPMACLATEPDPASRWEQRLEQDGVTAVVRLDAVGGGPLKTGGDVRLRVSLSTSHDGSPIPRALPGVWLDAADAGMTQTEAPDQCRQRITRYVRANNVSPQSLADLNGYDVLALNADASISVLDPRTQFAGKSSLRATIELPGVGFDWAATDDDTRLFVSVPSRSVLAVADLLTLKTTAQVALPGAPGRVRVHPGGQQVWVGVAAGEGDTSPGGVAIVQTRPPHRTTWLPMARGHVDMAFDPAGWVALTQRSSNRVVFVDPTTQGVAHAAELAPDAMPLGVVFDARARRFVVAEARSGRLLAFDHRGQPQGDLSLQPGIGPMALSKDGRWLLVANPGAHRVHAVDLASWRVVHHLPVSGRPFDISFTDGYAYVRALDTEAVTLVATASLGGTPRLQSIAMGERPPGRTPHLPIASQLVAMPDGAGTFIVSPGDNAVYFYMEGMNAAAGSVSARGHEARAVRVVRRGLREVAPGVFEQQITLPSVPRLLLALATDSPRMQHCLPLALGPADAPAAATQWALAWSALPTQSSTLALLLSGVPVSDQPRSVQVKLFQPGAATQLVEAIAQGQGRYEAVVPDLAPGLWYVHPQPPRHSGARWPYVSFVRKGTGS
jgi:DNA-binding beta-propeller fold protein YncE